MTATQMKIEDLCRWSEPKRVDTKNGPRNLRTGEPSDTFWNAWRSSKDALRAAGVSVGKDRGGNWQACWWLPLDAETQQKMAEADAASRAADANVTIPAPEGLSYLGYQKAGVASLLRAANNGQRGVLLADSMGLGKTIQAIGLWNIDPSFKKTIVICPASLRLNWKKEFLKWAVRPVRVAVVNGGKPTDWPTEDWDVLVINFDVVAKHRERIDAVSIDLLVVDEAHYIKSQTAKRSVAILGKRDRKGQLIQNPISCRFFLPMTGTPIVNRPIELFTLLTAVDPEGLGKNFFGYAKRYANATQTRWGWDFSGASRLDELQSKLRCGGLMIRRLKEEVLTELPAKRRQVIEIPANGASEKIKAERAVFDRHEAYIAELEERLQEAEIEASYDLREEDPEVIAALRRQVVQAKKVAFEEMSKVRHETALAKVPHVIEHLESVLEEGPVVAFAHHRDVVQQIADAFPGRSVILTGDTSMEDRQKAVDDFQAGKVDLFVGNIQAAGVGITLTRSSRVVFAELSWVPGELSQAEDRLHRIGQTDSVLVQHVVMESSVDEIMVKRIIAKQEVIDKALDVRKEANFGQAGPDSVTVTEQPTFEVKVKAEVVFEVQPDKVQEEAAKMTPERIAAVHQGLRMLAGMCDGARELDGHGFSKFDARIGHELASRSILSPRQALLGCKMCNKYRRQLPAELVATAKGEQQLNPTASNPADN